MKLKCLIILSLMLCFSFAHKSYANIDTVNIYSNVMHKASKAVIITPKNYNKRKLSFPVVYLLHGFSGNYADWVTKVPQMQNYATLYQTIIVCPDGGFSSWYLNSPIDSSFQYQTYVAEEVPAYVDAHYKTIQSAHARAITGLSMGGHGGLYLGLQYPQLFGACGSMSGGVDLHFSTRKFDLAKRIGDSATYPQNWDKYSVINLVDSYKTTKQAIIVDCGTNDFFYNINLALHAKMLQLNIVHDFIIRPGVHNWNYWSNAIAYQLLFFRKYFDNYTNTITNKN